MMRCQDVVVIVSGVSRASAVVIAVTTYLLCVAVYRLFLSPVARFPGPILAALTFAYEGYFDIFKEGGGRYWVEINRMHDTYGTSEETNA